MCSEDIYGIEWEGRLGANQEMSIWSFIVSFCFQVGFDYSLNKDNKY